jgi:hypothetical protein
VQTIPWGQSAGEAGVLFDSYGRSALHGFDVYLTGVGTRSDPALEGFFVIKNKIDLLIKKKKKKRKRMPRSG